MSLLQLLINAQANTQNLIITVGIQLEGLEQPTAITQVVEISTTAAPYITVHRANALLGGFFPRVHRHHIRGAYVPPDTYHPNGALLFTYVDELTSLAVITRGKIEHFETFYRIISSPGAIISSRRYIPPPQFEFGRGRERSVYGPLIFQSAGKPVVIYHSSPIAFNEFVWHGGYKFAGISNGEGTTGAVLSVVRAGRVTGISTYSLEQGFGYHVNNTGHLHSGLSITDLFTPFGFPFVIGNAISPSEILIERDVFERINNFS